MTNNKQKGKRVEREAAEMMEDLTGFEWKRTVFSGAMSSHRENKVYKGDIHCTNDDNLWNEIVVEVKSRKDSIKLQELFNKDSKWSSYIKQAHEQANNSWVLLVKVNYEGWFLAGNATKVEHVDLFNDIFPNRPLSMVDVEDVGRYDILRLDQ